MRSFLRFMEFWGTEQIEMLPYFLTALALTWILRRRGLFEAQRVDTGPGLFSHGPGKHCGLCLQPVHTVPGHERHVLLHRTVPLFAACGPQPSSIRAKGLLTVFCALLLSSVLLEARVFLKAQPFIASRQSNILPSIDYPDTDKLFFPATISARSIFLHTGAKSYNGTRRARCTCTTPPCASAGVLQYRVY